MTYRILPNALHFSEFQGGYHGTCGETALATALVCSTPQIESTPDAIALLLSLTKELISLGWASASGSTSTLRLHDEAIRRGFHPDESSRIDYSEPLDPTKLHTLLLAMAGVKPILLEIARGGNLPGDEAGLQYHFICIVGVTDAGYICNDGDNPATTSHLMTYSWTEIENARPCGVLVIEMQPQGVPAMWSRTANGAQDQHGHIIGSGLADLVFAKNLQGSNGLLGETYYAAGHSFAPLDNGVVVSWDGSAHDDQAAQVLAALYQNFQAQVNQLNAELSAAKAQPPTPAPVDPAVKAALLAAAQIVAPQVTLAQELADALSKL